MEGRGADQLVAGLILSRGGRGGGGKGESDERRRLWRKLCRLGMETKVFRAAKLGRNSCAGEAANEEKKSNENPDRGNTGDGNSTYHGLRPRASSDISSL